MRLHDANARNAPAEWQAAEPLDPAAWIPLTELALEGFGHGETLEARAADLRNELADHVLLDDIGRACVPRSVARDMFAERAARQAEERERSERVEAKRAEAAARHNEQVRADRERMKLIGKLQQQNGGGLLYENHER